MEMEHSNIPNLLPCLYLAIHSLFVLIGPQGIRSKALLLLANLMISMGFLFLAYGPWSGPAGPALRYQRMLVLWSPVIFFWWAYLWASHTLTAIHAEGTNFDRALIAWEERLFRQPSLHWARRGNRWVSELLHVGYFSYYSYTLIIGISLHLSGRIQEFQAATGAVMFSYMIAYTLFALVPVFGPRWSLVDAGLLAPSEQRVPGLWFTKLTHRLLFDGPAHKGGAMPSSHTSTAVIFAYWCFQIGGLTGGVMGTAAAASMAAGAIYGRYHFTLDILAGALIGVLSILLANYYLL